MLSFPISDELEAATQVPLGTGALVFRLCPEAGSQPQTHGRAAGRATSCQLGLLPQERPEPTY